MPCYEFRCLACRHVTERRLSMSDATQNIPCEHCDSHTAQRIISKSTFHLKGGGWTGTSTRQNTTAGTEDD